MPIAPKHQKQEILKRIQTLCSEHVGLDPAEITLYADLRDDLGLSLPELAVIFTQLQDEYGFTIPKESMKALLDEQMQTVDDMITFIQDELEL